MRGRLTFANVVSLLALFFALTAGSYAALSLPKNSVTTKQVKDHSLLKKDFKADQLPAGAQGPTGPQGLPGPQGVQGPIGPTGVANITIAQGQSTLCSGSVACSVGSATAICPAGTKPLGGGVFTDALYGDFAGSISVNNGYIVGADNFGSSSTATVYALAYCSAEVQSVKFPNGTTLRPMAGDRMAALTARKWATHTR